MEHKNENRTLQPLLTEEQLGGKARMYAKVTLNPGKEIAFHAHHGEVEAYHILSGVGEYLDNDKVYSVSAGDVTFCADGSSHGMRNRTSEPVVFVALIL